MRCASRRCQRTRPMRHSHVMMELRIDTRLGWIVALPCCIALVLACVALPQSEDDTLAAGLFAVFAAGLMVGVLSIIRPPILIRMDGEHLHLFPGSLFANRALASIPISSILSLNVRTADANDGVMGYIVIGTASPLVLSAKALRWTRRLCRSRGEGEAPVNLIEWPLWHFNEPEALLAARLNQWLAVVRGLVPDQDSSRLIP